jgi:hypothetical protein
VKTPHIICEHGIFLQNLREFLPDTVSSQLYKEKEKLCEEDHKVFSSRFKIYCSICTAEEDGVTIKIEEGDWTGFKDAGMPPSGN